MPGTSLQLPPLVANWDLKFFVGIDGLSATMLLLTSIVALAAVWLAPKVDDGENRYYACILLIAAGAAGAFRFPGSVLLLCVS